MVRSKNCTSFSLVSKRLWVGALLLGVSLSSGTASAQLPPPDRQSTFMSDSSKQQATEKGLIKKATKTTGIESPGVDFRAPIIEFDRNQNKVVGKGGVIIADSGVQVQADEGTFDTNTREGDVKGHVVVSSGAGLFNADAARLIVPSETGDFTNLDFEVEDGGYLVHSDKARKVSEFEFELEDSSFTTCHCPDGAKPWEMRTSSCSLTQEGYAHAYGSAVYFEGLPIFYSPYLALPVKNERASGILPPQWGISNQNGFMYRQPILGIIDDSSDFTLSPFIATESRYGSELTYERVFSETSQLSSGFVYSNESWRGDSLRGLNVDGVYDPTIDTNRTAGFWKQRWQPNKKLQLPVEFVADGRYTSDNLFLQEIPEPNIGDKQSQFLVSTAVLRGMAFNAINAEARAEYNQMLRTDQEVQTQRLPELSASSGMTFRPWGFNPYGLKVVTGAGATATDFVRQDGYDGWRTDVNPTVGVPFHISNYLKGQFSAQLHQTNYANNETMLPSTATPLPDGSTELDSSASRSLPIFGYGMSSGVERIYGVERDSWFAKAVNLGARNERSELVRLKHTIEPNVSYTYIPNVDQTYNPLYDQLDRFRERSLFGYGFTSRLYGRFFEPIERVRTVEELSSADETLPVFDLANSMLDFGRTMTVPTYTTIDKREGEIRQLALFSMRQTYDYIEATKDVDPNVDAFSDLNTSLILSPSSYFSTGFQTNYGTEDGRMHSYALSLGLMDDRDDMIRARYTFVEDSVNQLEANAEVALHPRVRLGGYARYDAEGNQMIESRGLIRFINSCKCWSADLGYGETINPDNAQVLFVFTFGGLGSIRQGVGITQQQSGTN